MIHNSRRGLYIQIGIVAGKFSDFCGESNKPSVFTLLNHPVNLDFMLTTIKNAGNSFNMLNSSLDKDAFV